MSVSIDQSFVRQFEAEVHEAYQRMGSKLRQTVRSKGDVKGSSTTFQKVGQGAAATKSRHGLVPVMTIDHTAIECVLTDYYAGDWIDKLDEMKVNIDERQVIANAGAYPARYARPLLHEDDLIGFGDWSGNPDSAGGNAINHPSTAGHCLMYAPAFGAFIGLLRSLPKPRVVGHSATSTTIATSSPSFVDTGDQVSVQAEAGEWGLISFNVHVVNQSPTTNANILRVRLNGAQIVATTQYLPPTDHRGVVVSMANVPVQLVQGDNTFKMQWMTESASHTLESRVPGRTLTVEKIG